jgi:hypothetical protein
MTCILAGLKDWQTLITGGIALLVGGMTVWAINRQIADLRAARKEDEKHVREVERAYVSGGGCRQIERRLSVDHDEELYDRSVGIIETADGSRILLVPTGKFELHINNHGKTPARLHHVAIRFCDAAALPLEPVYGAPFPKSDAIAPGAQSRLIGTVDIPEGGPDRVAICGRYYWDDIWGRHWSSGFIYEIPSKAVTAAQGNGSLSVEASHRYWDDREEEPPVVEGG